MRSLHFMESLNAVKHNVVSKNKTKKHSLDTKHDQLSGGAADSISPPPQTPMTNASTRPEVYQFVNYRLFIQRFFDYKKNVNPHYSASLFARKAGFGENSRGYLKLVIDGKRNLTAHTIRAFSEAMELQGSESVYFENLVYFNQAEKERDRRYYFDRMHSACKGIHSEPLVLLKSQFSIAGQWFVLAVREIVNLKDFQEDAVWICKKLRNKITKDQAMQSIQDLLRAGMLKRNAQGRLVQSSPEFQIKPDGFNEYLHQYHLQMMDRARESLENDPYAERNASGVILSIPRSRLPELIDQINEFRKKICDQMIGGQDSPDSVVHLNFQVFQLTPIEKDKEKNSI